MHDGQETWGKGEALIVSERLVPHVVLPRKIKVTVTGETRLTREGGRRPVF